MKKLFKNKKITTGIVATTAGVTVLLASLSLAWFISSGSVAANTITMGTLDVTASLGAHEIGVSEPGMDHYNQIGKIQNLGNLPTLVKLSLDSEITMADGTAGNAGLVDLELQLAGSDGKFVPSGFGYDVKAHELGMWFDFDKNNVYMWGELDGDIYIAMQGDDELHFAYTVDTDGRNMGNEYQESSINVSVEWEATQLNRDGAIEDVFGIDIRDINWLPGFIEAGTEPGFVMFSAPTGSAADRAAQVIANVLEDLPECGYRTLLESILAGM